MTMLPHHVDVRTDLDGLPFVEITFDLSAAQAGAAAHAVRIVRDVRYRASELSVDEVLAMRELTALADELSDLNSRGMHDRMTTSVARLGDLRSVVEEFAAAEHHEREGDAEARPLVFELADAFADIHAEAVRAALDGPARVR